MNNSSKKCVKIKIESKKKEEIMDLKITFFQRSPRVFSIIIVFFIILPPFLFSQEENLQQAPFNPQFLEFMQKCSRGEYYPWTEEGNYLGYIPPSVYLPHLKTGKSKAEHSNLFYPSTYDLRTYGKMTPVRNQGSCGSCWVFATYGSLESTLLTAETRDFSENHLKNTHGFDLSCCNGGNEFMSMAYLSRWSGPWNETDDPYNPSSCTSTTDKPVQKHIQNAFFVPENLTLIASIPDIKYAIMNYGAVKASYYHSDSYYNSTYKSYYYNGSSSTNHAVTIAGWDDTFSRTKFNNQPPGDGAFLVKNSWGTSWGASGYFYLSYYDSSLSGFTIFFGEPTANFDYIYQYDPLGWISSFGYGSETAWFANIFTATSNQYLLAVSFYVASPNSPYEIYIYTNVTSGPRTGTLSGTKTGTIENAGYNTILLNSPVSLSPGQKFSVVVKLTTPGYNYPIPIEYAYSGYSSGASASSGQSFISSNGTSWQDITSSISTANVCIKAFASNLTSCTPDLGDTNENGSITAIDASMILQYVAGLITFTPSQQCKADTNENSNITSIDASYVLQCVTGLCSDLPSDFRLSCQSHGNCP